MGVMYKEVVGSPNRSIGFNGWKCRNVGSKKFGTVVCADLSGHEIENACR